ncbi:glycosyltransferase [Clostridium sp. LP20]|uniref:glycosyltransferase n=1 Tax=Clostridium sp. LP20 TaxID=3418665 RepID=UPI003EE74CFC
MNKEKIKEYIKESINTGLIKDAYDLILQYKKTFGYEDEIASMEAIVNIYDQNYDKAMVCVKEGLRLNIFNSDLYYTMGNIYELKNEYNRAYLCYEQALRYSSSDENKKVIFSAISNLKLQYNIDVNNYSIVILTYNNLDYTKICIDSIKRYSCNEDYEIIVVDNNSTDGTVEWLRDQSGIKYILNNENKGFPTGCNQGIEFAEKGNDIFLLNNDTVIMPNSIFNLRMGLYSEESVGATGSVSNKVSYYQEIEEIYDDFDGYMNFSLINNIVNEDFYEERIKLVGFAMLIKRNALDKVGLLDERFTPGNFEDDDLSLRILREGYKLLLCKDSYIHHFGSVSFGKDMNKYRKLILENSKKFEEKWGFKNEYATNLIYDLLNKIDTDRLRTKENINILEIGCGLGATLMKIKNVIPNANIYGIENSEEILNIIKDIETLVEVKSLGNANFKDVIFDVIISSKDDMEACINSLKSNICSNSQIIRKDYIYNQENTESTGEETVINDDGSVKFYSLKQGSYLGERYNITDVEAVSIGSNVTIKDGSWFNVCVPNPNKEKRIIINDGCTIGSRFSISVSKKCIIERNVLIGPNVYISDCDHIYENIGIPIMNQGITSTTNEVIIGENSWIGVNSAIVGNVHIGKGCVVGANSYVTKDVPDYSVVGGNPARILKMYDTVTQGWIPVKNENEIKKIIQNRKEQPLISICIPTFNREKELEKCLESIYTQIGNDSLFEVFISNNNSQDGTEKIIKRYEKLYNNLTYHKNEENIGGDKNIALVIEKSKGKYIMVHGDDDYFKDNTIYQIMNIINTNLKQSIFFLNVLSNDNKAEAFSGINEFLKNTSINAGFISSIIMKREEYKKVQEPFKFMDSGFNQIYLQYMILLQNPEFIIINSPIFTYEGNNPYGYNFGRVFIKSYLDIINYIKEYGLDEENIREDKQKILQSTILPWYKYIVENKLDIDISGFDEYFTEYYKDEIYFKELCEVIQEIRKSGESS